MIAVSKNRVLNLLRSDKAPSLLEQLLLSGGNFILMLVCARYLSVDAWGTYSLAFALLLFAQGFQRALLSLPIVRFSRTAELLTTHLPVWRSINAWLVMAIVAISSCIGLSAWSVGLPSWISDVCLILVFLTPGYFFYEYQKRIVIGYGQIRLLTAMSLTVVAIMATGTFLAMSHVKSAASIGLAVGLGYLAGATVGSALLSSMATNLRESLATEVSLSKNDVFSFSLWSILCHLAYAGYTTINPVLLSAFGGPGAVAVFAAIRNLGQPVQTLIAAVDNVDKQKASAAYHRGGKVALNKVIFNSMKVMLLLGGSYLLLICVSAEWMLGLLYNDKYTQHKSDVYLWAIVFFFMIFSQPLESAMYVLGKPKNLFYGRAFAAVIGIGGATLFIPKYGSSGAIVSLGVAWMIAGLVSFLQMRRAK